VVGSSRGVEDHKGKLKLEPEQFVLLSEGWGTGAVGKAIIGFHGKKKPAGFFDQGGRGVAVQRGGKGQGEQNGRVNGISHPEKVGGKRVVFGKSRNGGKGREGMERENTHHVNGGCSWKG